MRERALCVPEKAPVNATQAKRPGLLLCLFAPAQLAAALFQPKEYQTAEGEQD